MALPDTIVLGDRVKTKVKANSYNNVYVYAVRRLGTRSGGPSYYETIRANTGVYPSKPGLNLSGFARLYDALVRFDFWSTNAALLPAPTTVTSPALTAKTVKVDGFFHGGSGAGG